MIVGFGIDVCPVDRIAGVCGRQPDFETTVFTAAELAYARGAVKAERLAARWAVKEAAIKALGAPSGLSWHDIEIHNQDDGAPVLILHGAAQRRAEELEANRRHVTITHAGGIAVAAVILEKTP